MKRITCGGDSLTVLLQANRQNRQLVTDGDRWWQTSSGEYLTMEQMMTTSDDSWEARLAALWVTLDTMEAQAFISSMDAMAAELPHDAAIGLFERGAARDSCGFPALAVPLYKAALEVGLTGLRRRRANIQMASSIRYLGDPQIAADLLTAEMQAGSDELDGAVRAFLALALADLGREREALAISLTALSTYLPRYNRSLARYAQAL
ncbi:tetratricopeptide repeat protein [Undibacterium sp. Di26W]|uniref:tetratricopeptide repeat protein n=1 Tax=Undibacterium sp. Di26W TaxID=3413035 RepID=UPI003BF04179